MSVFSSIMSKIFNAAESALGKAEHPAGASAPTTPGPAQSVNATVAAPDSAPASGAATQAAPQATSQPVDVEAVLSALAAGNGGGGNWQTSIVDLLKLLDLDSSLNARKELANELNVHAGADGSAEENIALHKAVMQKLEENGGKVPASLKG